MANRRKKPGLRHALAKARQSQNSNGAMHVPLVQLLNSFGSVAEPGPLLNAYRTKMPGPVQLQLVRLMRDVRAEIASYAQAVDELAMKHGAKKEVLEGDAVEYKFTDRDKPTAKEQEKIDAFNKEHQALLQTEIVLQHSKMPALLSLINLSGPEYETLEWLVAEQSEQPKENP